MINKSSQATYSALIISAVVATVAATWWVTSRSTTADEPRTSTGSAVVAQTQSASDRPLSTGTLASLRDRDTTFVEVAPASSEAQQSAAVAASAVGKEFEFIAPGSDADELALGRLTIGHYGKELAAPTEPSRVDPYIQNRLVWLVVNQDLDLPLYGPPGTEGSYRGGMWTAVDAVTGEVLASETLLYPPDYES